MRLRAIAAQLAGLLSSDQSTAGAMPEIYRAVKRSRVRERGFTRDGNLLVAVMIALDLVRRRSVSILTTACAVQATTSGKQVVRSLVFVTARAVSCRPLVFLTIPNARSSLRPAVAKSRSTGDKNRL